MVWALPIRSALLHAIPKIIFLKKKKEKENINNLSFAELAHEVVKIKEIQKWTYWNALLKYINREDSSKSLVRLLLLWTRWCSKLASEHTQRPNYILHLCNLLRVFSIYRYILHSKDSQRHIQKDIVFFLPHSLSRDIPLPQRSNKIFFSSKYLALNDYCKPIYCGLKFEKCKCNLC